MLKWVIERVEGTGEAVGHAHRPGARPSTGSTPTASTSTDDTLAKLVTVDAEAWRGEIQLIEGHYESIGERLPDELRDELRELEKRLASST